MSEYTFDRYRKGVKMAEGIRITRQPTLEDAVTAAARLADAGDVLVLRENVAELQAEREKVAKLEKGILEHRAYMMRFSEGKEPHLAHDRELYALLAETEEIIKP